MASLEQLGTMSELEREAWAADLRRRRDAAHARLDATVETMGDDYERLDWDEFAEIVDP